MGHKRNGVERQPAEERTGKIERTWLSKELRVCSRGPGEATVRSSLKEDTLVTGRA